jgi:hypothetical protein
MAQRHRDDELRDPRRLLAVDDSRDANLRRKLGREQLLDPGRDRAHPAHARQAGRQAGRHLPAEDDIDVGELGVAQRRAVFEQLEIGARARIASMNIAAGIGWVASRTFMQGRR